MKATILFFLLTSVVFGQAPASQQVSSLSNRQAECSFEPKISPDDQGILNSAVTAIQALRDSQKCKELTPQFDAFEKAVQDHNKKMGYGQVQGTDGKVIVTCSNYDRVYDMEHEYFTNTWQSPPLPATQAATDPYHTCRSAKPVRESVMECAAKITASNKSIKKAQCASQKESFNEIANNTLITDSYKTGMQAMQAIMQNKECLDANGSQKASFLHSAVGLAGRAATLGAMGTGAGFLYVAAADLVGSALHKIINFFSEGKDDLAGLKDLENFTKMACLYEKLEDKGRRCDRIRADRAVSDTRNLNEKAKDCILKSREVIEVSDLIKNMDSIMAGLRPTDKVPGKPFNEQLFNELADNLNKTFPGSDESVLVMAKKSAAYVIAELEKITGNDENLRAHWSKLGNMGVASGSTLRGLKTRLVRSQENAQAVYNVLSSIKTADDKGTGMSKEDLGNVAELMKDFKAADLSFVGAFNEVLQTRASFIPNDDVAMKINLYNASLIEANAYQSTIEKFNQQKAASTTSFDDGGRFEIARQAMQISLRRSLNNQLKNLFALANDNKFNHLPAGVPSATVRPKMMQYEEDFIYPMLRACNQLQSVMNLDQDKTPGVDLNGQHEACRAFSCNGGMKTFADFLKDENILGKDGKASDEFSRLYNKKCNSLECQAQYDRYICQEKANLSQLREKFKNEFLNEGTICGRSAQEAFHRQGPKPFEFKKK